MPKTSKMRMISSEEFTSLKNNQDIINQIYSRIKRMNAYKYLCPDEIEDAINLSILKGAGYHIPGAGNSITTNIINFLIKILRSEYKKKNRERYKKSLIIGIQKEKAKKANNIEIDFNEIDIPERYKTLYQLVVKDNERMSSICKKLDMKRKRVIGLIKEMLVYLNKGELSWNQ